MKNNRRCIFLIDDDEITNKLNALIIEDLNICSEILTFTNSEDAFYYLNQTYTNIPIAVFIDYNLTDTIATEATKHLKEISPGIKTVILTAYINDAQSKEVLKNPNIDDLIFKPLTEEKLVGCLKKIGLMA